MNVVLYKRKDEPEVQINCMIVLYYMIVLYKRKDGPAAQMPLTGLHLEEMH